MVQTVVVLLLAKEKERRVSLLDGVLVATDCLPCHATKENENNGGQKMMAVAAVV
jgi:hypothetical protein